jgi:hypothetical protein
VLDGANSPALSITQQGLNASLSMPAQSKVYGSADPALASLGVTLGGLVNRTVGTWNGNVAVDDSALGSSVTALTRAAGENVGTYAITAASFGAPSANYSMPAFDGSNTPALAITPAPLVVTADNATKVATEPLPPFTAQFSGFAFGETPGSLGGSLAFATPATQQSPPGTYVVTPLGLDSGNYTITYLPGTLTVTAGGNQQLTSTYATLVAPPGSPPPSTLPAFATAPLAFDLDNLPPTAAGPGAPTVILRGPFTLLNGGVRLPLDLPAEEF